VELVQIIIIVSTRNHFMLLQNDVYRCMMIAYTYKKRLLGEERKWGGRLYATKFQL